MTAVSMKAKRRREKGGKKDDFVRGEKECHHVPERDKLAQHQQENTCQRSQKKRSRWATPDQGRGAQAGGQRDRVRDLEGARQEANPKPLLNSSLALSTQRMMAVASISLALKLLAAILNDPCVALSALMLMGHASASSQLSNSTCARRSALDLDMSIVADEERQQS
ncbi:hypothetical protein SERLA73DRAFT_78023 [Serpula lacrymans var. lacrymans S7.3]|uniref:Uncharacterized protein n=2 Tax=Serpula lacrymans var. lacrymans TaxID=341189 RepID=F8QBX7_SERL3|nr:uncharacterized protein SERLADRAFT_442982 [Serpula lacrymans var. lacrymans S7.9]EGN94096.1 hypothetical protein SERLA73DRAFT_78023 [Serpula lacrymans var. lacrymans S7.3]EGO19507.1 hypothetical protein SERLADRAFT_442982 [Serpula lacrymans var. lacrymans S7.9]